MLVIFILLDSLLDLTTLIQDKLSVHILQFVVSEEGVDVCEFDRSCIVEFDVWSVLKLMSPEWISSNE